MCVTEMHDGYLFTLGICGSAAADHPALFALNTMLGALPPVKRAVYLGPMVSLNQYGQLYDPLLEPIVCDMRDAELLLIVTPVSETTLPARLARLLDHGVSVAGNGMLRDKVVALIVITLDTAPAAEMAARKRLQHFCATAGMQIAGQLSFTVSAVMQPSAVAAMMALARQAYTEARQRVPDALPRR